MTTARGKTTPSSTEGSFAPHTREAPEVTLDTPETVVEHTRKERAEALERYFTASAAYTAANARFVAASVRAIVPGATGLTLEESDQEGSSWSPFYIVGPGGERVETPETDQLFDDIWTEVGDLPYVGPYLETTGKFTARLDIEAASQATLSLASASDIAEQAWGEDWRERIARGDISPEGVLRAIELAQKSHSAE